MSREQRLIAAFVEFADTFVAEYDVVEFLHRLAKRCVEFVDAADAGIMLAGPAGALAYVASSSERMRLIELFELQHEEGPCLDAYRDGVAVHANLSADAETRWPRLASRAREVGFQSVSALPMRLRDDVIGALNLFSTAAGPLSVEDQQVAQALADIATIGILQERALHDEQVVTSQLQSALASRVVIEQAKGIIAQSAGVSMDDAFKLLRAYARRHNCLLSRTASDVIAGVLTAEAVTQPSPLRS